MTSISVIIRCLNEAHHIGRLLAGIQKQSLLPDEIVVIDSGSTDATLDIAASFPLVRIVTIQPDQFSFGRSLNIACQASHGDLLVLASAHTYPLYDSWLAELLSPFDDFNVALTYGRQQGDHRTRYSERQIFRRWYPPTGKVQQPHPFCNNANAAVRRSVWESLPYDEDLTGLEDIDWAKRASAKGYTINYVAAAAAVHVHQENWAQVRNRYRREAIACRQIYPEERLGLPHALGLMSLSVLSDLTQAAGEHCLMRELLGVARFRLAQFAGAYQGYRQTGPISSGLRRKFYYPHRLGIIDETFNTTGGLLDYPSFYRPRTRDDSK